MWNLQSFLFAFVFIGHGWFTDITVMGQATTGVTSFIPVTVAGGQVVTITEVASLVGQEGSTQTFLVEQFAGTMTITETLILSPTTEVVIEDVEVPGIIRHERLNCNIDLDGTGHCSEVLSQLSSGSVIQTTFTFESQFDPPNITSSPPTTLSSSPPPPPPPPASPTPPPSNSQSQSQPQSPTVVSPAANTPPNAPSQPTPVSTQPSGSPTAPQTAAASSSASDSGLHPFGLVGPTTTPTTTSPDPTSTSPDGTPITNKAISLGTAINTFSLGLGFVVSFSGLILGIM